jgi:DNA polymerase-3 subunit epsilon
MRVDIERAQTDHPCSVRPADALPYTIVQLAFTTADDLAALLEQAGEPLDYREVWPRLFPVANCPPELMHALVDDIVNGDERFAWESSVHVGLAVWQAQRHDLSEVTFTVVDLETTGSTPGFAKITEIGAVRIEGGEVVGTFSQLVDPRQVIPPMVTGITGISQDMVAGQPLIGEVLPRFVEFSAGSVLVGHNARFDLSFLDYELGILTRETFPRPALDTLRLARKLLPQGCCSLGSLALRLGLPTQPSHRALPDAQATGELLLVLLARLEEQGVTTLEGVARLCEPEARRNYHKIVLTEGLPTTPGVYIMRDGRGAALYIGKAENLRRRARDHFLQRQAYGATQALELLERFEIIETGSEFAALLLESRLIARHKPPCNRHGTRVSSYHYVKLTADAFPRVYATPNLRDDGSLYAGPFRKASFARRFAEVINQIYPLRTCTHMPVVEGSEAERALSLPAETEARHASSGGGNGDTSAGSRGGTDGPAIALSRYRHPRRVGEHACVRSEIGACLAPCRNALNGEYHALVERVRLLLEGDGGELDRYLSGRQEELVSTLAFEQAARLRDQREIIEHGLRLVRRLREALQLDAVLVYPSVSEGRVTLYGVAAGRIVFEREARPGEIGLDEARRLIADVVDAAPPVPPLPTETIDELLLVHGWLRKHREAVNVLMLGDDGSDEAAAAELCTKISLCAAPEAAPALV